jgi:hypothetical protein
MNDGQVNHEAGFREKLLTCVGVIENTQPYRQNKSEQGDAYFISLRMTMLAHPKTRVGQIIKKKRIRVFFKIETKALLSYLTMLSLKQLSVLANVLLEAFGIQDAEKLPEPSSILVPDGITTSEDDDSEDLFPRKYKVVACKKKTFKERSKKKEEVWVGRALRFGEF